MQGWVDGGDENFDYGAIILPTPLGETVGTFGFGVLSDDELDGAVLNIAGYPGDKAAGTLWFDSHTVARTGPTKVHYDIDTAGGQSGAAVYVINDDWTGGSRSPSTPTAGPPPTPVPGSRRRCSAT